MIETSAYLCSSNYFHKGDAIESISKLLGNQFHFARYQSWILQILFYGLNAEGLKQAEKSNQVMGKDHLQN